MRDRLHFSALLIKGKIYIMSVMFTGTPFVLKMKMKNEWNCRGRKRRKGTWLQIMYLLVYAYIDNPLGKTWKGGIGAATPNNFYLNKLTVPKQIDAFLRVTIHLVKRVAPGFALCSPMSYNWSASIDETFLHEVELWRRSGLPSVRKNIYSRSHQKFNTNQKQKTRNHWSLWFIVKLIKE